MTAFFIPGNVPSSKNSKVWTGKYLVWSKTARKYVKDTEDKWIELKSDFVEEFMDRELPRLISFQFIRGSKHKFDYVNPLQTVLDLMVRYEWIPDDNADIVLPVFIPYLYSKEEPGVIIQVM